MKRILMACLMAAATLLPAAPALAVTQMSTRVLSPAFSGYRMADMNPFWPGAQVGYMFRAHGHAQYYDGKSWKYVPGNTNNSPQRGVIVITPFCTVSQKYVSAARSNYNGSRFFGPSGSYDAGWGIQLDSSGGGRPGLKDTHGHICRTYRTYTYAVMGSSSPSSVLAKSYSPARTLP